jgi:hypothetical protein
LGDSSYAETTHAFAGVGLRPLAPVHVGARREAGDIQIGWVRRTRVGGDGWETAEVPLGEAAELYEVDVLTPGGEVVRTLVSEAPAVTYSAAQQTADFGGPVAALHVAVAQVSAVYGRGIARRAIV